MNKEHVSRESLEVFLHRELVKLETEYMRLCSKYTVSSVEEMENLYQEGAIDEKDTREDFMRLDFLEDRITKIKNALEELR
jgi:hypothetical protein